ncbi:MAG: hypothetical protein HOE80_01755 [Candidatus Magasanikbacteria bacterium]|jgi:HTH-type transcriptional regulator, sugar sensing transcriptional regulator|nr:hypothetical protein [Candidatus Magasanikbacteria bacterium]MBT4071427.1 hypothetical protein [Candidatus Magasanikbacteria bacterium]
MSTLLNSIKEAGMEAISAEIYLILINNGELTPKKIMEHTDLSRASIHEALNDLFVKDFITYRKEGRNAYYTPVHPNKLQTLVEEKKRETKIFEHNIIDTIHSLSGAFNLTQNKPGVRFFEGVDGIKEVLKDTFVHNTSKQIYAFTDLAGYAETLGEWNTKYYAKKRKDLGINLKALVPDNEKALEFLKGYVATELTDILFIDHTKFPFSTEINIYNGRVSFVSFAKEKSTGILIENEAYYQTMKSIFEFAWKTGHVYNDLKQPDWKNEGIKKDTRSAAEKMEEDLDK